MNERPETHYYIDDTGMYWSHVGSYTGSYLTSITWLYREVISIDGLRSYVWCLSWLDPIKNNMCKLREITDDPKEMFLLKL